MFRLRYTLCRQKILSHILRSAVKNIIGIVTKQNKLIYDKCYRIKNVKFILKVGTNYFCPLNQFV